MRVLIFRRHALRTLPSICIQSPAAPLTPQTPRRRAAGIRRSLLVCFTGELISRLLIATATSPPLIYFLLYTLLPAASSLGVPVMTIAVKRYTPPGARSLAFGLFYTVMNVAALAAGFIVDGLRTLACRTLGAASGGTGSMLMHDSNRLVIASGALTSAVALIVTAFLSRAVEAEALERERAEAEGWGGIAAGDGEEGALFAVPERASPGTRHQLHSQTAGVDEPCASMPAHTVTCTLPSAQLPTCCACSVT